METGQIGQTSAVSSIIYDVVKEMCETYDTMALCYYVNLYMMKGFTENLFCTKTLQLQINAAMLAEAQTSTITSDLHPQKI